MTQSKHPTRAYRDDLIAELRQDPSYASVYLNAALEEGRGAFLVALKDVVDARLGMSGVARETELHRVALHRALSESGNPTLDTLGKVLDALGLRIRIDAGTAVEPSQPATGAGGPSAGGPRQPEGRNR